MNILRQRLLIFFVPLLLSLPFLNRAYFVDDHYFVQIAAWLSEHPALPYHFSADDAGPQTRGWEENGFVRMVNPLLHHYVLALIIKLAGAREWILRLGCVLLSCFSALFIFSLARRWAKRPFLVTLLILLTPVHWLTAHSLLIDSTMGFFFFGALLWFVLASERDSLAFVVLSGLFMGCAFLSKYTALLILPVTGVWWLLNLKISQRSCQGLKRPWIYVVAWGIGLLFLLAYSAWTAHLYGRPHILAASERMVRTSGWGKWLVFFVFMSGATLAPLLSWGLAGLRRSLVVGLVSFSLGTFLSTRMGGFTWIQGQLIALWFTTSLLFLGQLVVRGLMWQGVVDRFLLLWVLSFMVMMFVVMDWVAVRYYVIVTPALIFLLARLVEDKWPVRGALVLSAAAAVLLVVTGGIGYADYKQSDASRNLVGTLEANGFEGGDRHFYLGDSFTMSYLMHHGWTACFPDTVFRVGDQIIGNEVTMPLKWFARRPVVLREIAQFEYPSRFPIKIMDYEGSAGFYASVWGALPFTISLGPWERFHLFEVVALRNPS